MKDGIIYVASLSRNFYAMDAKTGKFVWRKGLSTDMVYSTPVVSRDRIYIAFKSGHIRAYNRNDGADVSDWQLPAEINSTPVVAGNGTVYAGAGDGYVYALDAKTGTILWKYATGGGIHSSPAVVDNNLYIGSGDGSVYAFRNRRKTGFRKTQENNEDVKKNPSPYKTAHGRADTFAAVSSYAAEKRTAQETLPLREGEALSTIINPTSR